MNRLAASLLLFLFTAAPGLTPDAVAQTDVSPLAQRTSADVPSALVRLYGGLDDDEPGLSMATRDAMQHLEAQSISRPLRLRLGADLAGGAAAALPAGTYRARHLLFTADSVHWVAPGRTSTAYGAPLWRLQHVTSQHRKRGALVGSAFGSLLGLAAGAAIIQFTGQIHDGGASIGPSLGAIPVGSALGALAGYARGSRRRYAFDDLPKPPAPPPFEPASRPDPLARLEGELERVRQERGMLTDRVGELEQALWDLEERLREEQRAGTDQAPQDSLRARLRRLERRLDATAALAAQAQSASPAPDVRPREDAREQRAKLLRLAEGAGPAYAVVVASLPRREDALGVARQLEALLLRYRYPCAAAVLPSEQGTHRAAFGPFENAAAARQTLDALGLLLSAREDAALVPPDAWVVRLR